MAAMPRTQTIVSQRVTWTQGAGQEPAPAAATKLYLADKTNVTLGRERASPYRELMEYL